MLPQLKQVVEIPLSPVDVAKLFVVLGHEEDRIIVGKVNFLDQVEGVWSCFNRTDIDLCTHAAADLNE